MNKVEAQTPLAKRLLISFFALALVVGLMPINAWAEGDGAQSGANQEQQAGQDEGDSAGDSTDDTTEKGSTESADPSASGDATADKGSSDGDDSSAGKSVEGADSSASEGSDADNDKSSASNESEESKDSSGQNGDNEESADGSDENALESAGQNGISLASVSNDEKPYLTYDHKITEQEFYDRLDTYYDCSPWPVHVYKEQDGSGTGDELATLSYLHDMKSKEFPIQNFGQSSYYCDWTAFGYSGILTLREQVNIDSPARYVDYDEKEHKWVPEVTATVNPNFSSSDYVVSYYRGDNETFDFTTPGEIKVLIQGKGNYFYVREYKTYTIQKSDTLSVSGTDYEGYYDGESHGDAAVASYTEGTTIKYSTDGNNWFTDVPTVKDVTEDAVTVYVRATNPHCTNTAEASYTLKVNKAKIAVRVEGNSQTDTEEESNAVTYDGTEHSVEGFEVTKITGQSASLYSKDEVTLRDGVEAVEAKGTDAGDYYMGLTADSFANGDPNFDVTFRVTDGVLTIKPAELTVSVKGNSDTQTYNGAEQSASGFEVTGVEGDQAQLYSTDKVALADGVAAEAKGTDAGTYDMGLTKESFANNDSNFNVSFNVTDGSLTIDKRALELNDSASFVYNGKEQVLNIDASKVAGLVDGDRLNLFNAQVKGTEPGTYDEVSEYSWDVINDELNVTKNYTLNVTGALTITEADSSADADADSESSDNESSDNGSDAGSDSETPQTGDFAQFAMGSALAAAIAALGALLATRRFRGERL